MKSLDDFRPYQHYMKKRVMLLEAMLIALDMGMGKTAIILMAIREMLLIDISRVLVISTVKVIDSTWPDEMDEWDEFLPLRYQVLTGTPAQRKKAVRNMKARIHLINRENLKWLYNYWGKDWPYDMVVWDDAGGLKSWKHRTGNKTLTRFGIMAKIRPYLKKFVALTGTPTPNGLYDLGGQMFIVDRGERLGRSRRAFEQRWFDADYMGWEFTPKPHAFREITSLIKDRMVSLRAEDYMYVPKTLIIPEFCTLPKKIMQEYRKFESSLVSETYDVEAVSEGVLTNKLLQFANGSMYQQDEGERFRRTIPIHGEKLDVLDRIINETGGENILLAYQFKFDVKAILKRFPWATVESDEPDFIRLWNKKKIRLGISHAASIGHGTNLQYGGFIAVWYGLTWNLEWWQQFNKRLPRTGQESKKCLIYPILARGTMDEIQYASLQSKGATQSEINKAVAAKIRDTYRHGSDDFEDLSQARSRKAA